MWIEILKSGSTVLFNDWELRAVILLSLFCQTILALLVSVAYSAADSAATVAMGIVARAYGGNSAYHYPTNNDNDSSKSLHSFWAMFLLLHLGGPDTISADDLVDNDLWHRHLAVLVFQIGVALYLFFRSWGSTLSFVAVPVFIAGVFKFRERTWALRSSSIKHFRNSVLSRKYDDLQGDIVRPSHHKYFLLEAPNFLFKRLRYLFAGIKLHIDEGKRCYSTILILGSAEKAFRMVEFELGLLYDVLYTKATIMYSGCGIFVRCISFLACSSALVTFPIIQDYNYRLIDIYITYILLCGAVILELHAFLFLIDSDWTKLWLLRRGLDKFLFVNQEKVMQGKRWSRSIARFNLVRFCLKKEAVMPKWVRDNYEALLPLFVLEKLDKFDQNVIRREEVDPDLQQFIFDQLQKIRTSDGAECRKAVLDCRADFERNKDNKLKTLLWSAVDVEFYHSLLLWHIATDLCYYDDTWNGCLQKTTVDENSKISKCLSDYMLYLLFQHPNMLPKGVRDDIRLREAFEDAINFVGERKMDDIEDCYKQFMEEGRKDLNISPMGDNSEDAQRDVPIEESSTMSILKGGCKLACQLQQSQRDCKRKWEMMNRVWVELLTFAAGHCEWIEHAKMLSSCGKRLTHVCLLMANFGLSDLYQSRQTRDLYSSQLLEKSVKFLDKMR